MNIGWRKFDLIFGDLRPRGPCTSTIANLRQGQRNVIYTLPQQAQQADGADRPHFAQ